MPPNDDFVTARPIGLGDEIVGTTRHATRELREPTHDDGTLTVWYRFRPPTAGEVRLSVCGRSPPRIAVYTGRRVRDLSRVAGIGECFVQFTASAGVTYRIVVVDAGLGEPFSLRARPALRPPNDDFMNATPIAVGETVAATTRDATREPGEPVAVWGYPLTVWFRLTIPEPSTVLMGACGVPALQIAAFEGEQLNALRFIGASNTCSGLALQASQPTTVQLQVSSPHDGDFNLSVRIAPPQP